jgi:tetraacyldisaccharide 4'-kinase
MRLDLETVWAERGVEAWLLSPLGGLYACGWWAYEAAYKLGIKRALSPPMPTVTIGNLIAGGAGKTPLALSVCRLLAERGRRVVLSMNGYRSPNYLKPALAPPGPLDPRVWGDEPSMARVLEPEVPIVVGKDRVAAAQIAAHHHADAVLVLDDGFQHLRLRQDCAIVIDPSMDNRFCLPAGPYREPWRTGRQRAALVVPNERFDLFRSPTRLAQVHGPPQETPKEVILLIAVARPYRIVRSLEEAGFRLKTVHMLPDHADLTRGTLPGDGSAPLVVTTKDWVKIGRRNDIGDRPVFVAEHRIWIEPQALFAEWLESRIDSQLQQTVGR